MAQKKLQGNSALEACHKYSEQFKKAFRGRKDEIDMLTYAVLLKENILMRGEPGLAKTMLARQFFGHIESGKLFSQQFTPFMDETNIFGPTDIEELKRGRVIHNTENSLLDCNFAILDEFYNASDELLTSTNSVLNEKEFIRNSQQIKIPLITSVATTNHMSREKSPEIKPIHDRFLFVSEVSRLKDPVDRILMYTSAIGGKLTEFETISLGTVQTAHEHIASSKVVLNRMFLLAFDKLFTNLVKSQNSKFLSDRKAVKALGMVKVITLMDQNTTSLATLQKLRLALADSGNLAQISEFDKCLASVVSTHSKDMDWIDRFTEAVASGPMNHKTAHALLCESSNLSDEAQELYKTEIESVRKVTEKNKEEELIDEEIVFKKDEEKMEVGRRMSGKAAAKRGNFALDLD